MNVSANSFGHFFKITSFGESHGGALGVVIEGCPAGIEYNEALLKKNLQRRRPGQSGIVSGRNELDVPEILSGIYQGQTLGTPICVIVKNNDAKSEDYSEIKNAARIGHADDTWKAKYGHMDHRGGGRSSGRETLARVIAGSFAEMLCLKLQPQIKLKSYASQIADFELTNEERKNIWNLQVDDFVTRFPSLEKNQKITELLEKAKAQGESYGGTVETQIINLPAGLGQPVFHKFKSDLAAAVMSIGATTSFEFGAGAESTKYKGRDFHTEMSSTVYGGIRGGITTGDPVNFRVGFKPTSSIMDVAKKGRHDPCIVTRAVPVVEAMTWILIADHLLWSKVDRV